MTFTPPSAPASDAELVPNRARVYLDAVEHNARVLRGLVGERAALMAVVKADAYGHGAVAVARAALAGGASWLGVAHPASALELVAAGVDAPILAWLYEPVTARGVLPQAIAAGVDMAVSSPLQCQLMSAAARECGARARVHVKLDTGMGRGGLTSGQVDEVARLIARDEYLNLAGAMSHFFLADAPGDPSIDAQAEEFGRMCARIEEVAGPIPLRHMGNTAIAQSRPDLHFDMVRAGIGLYGYEPIKRGLDLRPAMSLTSRIALVKDVEAGQSVGYGAVFTTDRPTRFALVPFGYADGLSRALTSQITVVVHTESGLDTVPVVGRISMDQIVLDLGSRSDAKPGDEVVILDDPRRTPGALTAADHARLTGTISYEILTSIPARVPREYVAEASVGLVAPAPTELTEPAGSPNPASSPTPSSRFERAFRIPTAGAEDTREAGRALAGLAQAGDLFVLDGPLGAGKTTFTQGFGQALGVEGRVASPTFVIARVHPSTSGGPDLVHVDAYRLDEDWDIDDLDLDSDMDTSVTVVEWGRDRVEHLADSFVIVELSRADHPVAGDDDLDTLQDPDDTDEQRLLTVTFVGERFAHESDTIASALAAAGFTPWEDQ